MPDAPGAAFGALDATVQAADNQPDVDPVARAEAELAQAEDTVERLTRKRDNEQQALDDAKQALADAQAAVKDCKRSLTEAKKASG